MFAGAYPARCVKEMLLCFCFKAEGAAFVLVTYAYQSLLYEGSILPS